MTPTQGWVTAASGRAAPYQSGGAPAAPAAPAAGGEGGSMPPSLKVYAERCFATCSGDAERAAMQGKLHMIISSALDAKRLHIIDWNTAPIPPLTSIKPPTTAASSRRDEKYAASSSSSLKRREDFYGQQGSPSSPSSSNKGNTKKHNKRSRTTQENNLESSSSSFSSSTAAELAARSMRADRFAGQKKQKKQRGAAQQQAAAMARRYHHQQQQQQISAEPELSFEPVRGTCEDLEKDYFRLTSAPDPSTVRPEVVLTEALQRLKHRWRDGEVDYLYMCNQLKAIRQDLTVQCLQDRFAVHVYETHARIALENADLNEYNQCQTQLKELYAQGTALRNQMEFVAYHIFYQLYLQEATNAEGSAPMLKILNEMPPAAWADHAVGHACRVREAVASNDAVAFFALKRDTPNMGAYILDLLEDKVRLQAAYVLVKAFKPSIPLDAFQRHLGLDDPEAARDYARKIHLNVENDEVLTKDARVDPAGLKDDENAPSSLL